MAQVDLRPVSDHGSNLAQALPIGVAVHGAYGALSDNNDATYIHFANPPGMAYVDVTLASLTISSNQRIAGVRPDVRYKLETGTSTDFYAIIISGNSPFNEAVYDHWTDNFSALAWRNALWRTFNPDGHAWVPSDLGRLLLQDNGGGNGRPMITEALVHVDVRTQCSCFVTGPTGPQSTRTPNITWSFSDPDGQLQKSFQVKIFTAAVATGGGFNPDTSTPEYDSGVQVGNNNGSNIQNWQVGTSLGDNNFFIYVKSSKDFNGSDWWSLWANPNQAQVSSAPPLPSSVTPANGATVNTDTPVLTAYANPDILGETVKVAWQIATDSGFQNNVIDAIEPDANLRSAGAAAITLSAFTPLSLGVWFIQAREINSDGTPSTTWTSPHSFTVFHVPNAINLAPNNSMVVNFGLTGAISLSWDFSDTSPVDFQTAYQVIAESNLDGTSLVDTGKISSAVASAVVSIDAGYQNTVLRWKVRLWDRADQVGPYSDYALFITQPPPAVTIDSPTEGLTVGTAQPTVTWTYNTINGVAQGAYRLIFTDTTDTTLAATDTGWITGSDSTYTPSAPILVNGHAYTIEVMVQAPGGLSGNASVHVTASWLGGPPPTVTVDGWSFYDVVGGGYVDLTWTGTVHMAFHSWRVYRRLHNAASWSLVGEIFNDTLFEFHDYTAPATNVDYAVVQAISSGGSILEGAYIANTINLASTSYWLIPESDVTSAFNLYSVSKDDPTEEYETAFTTIVDSGRHVDYGTRAGWKGTLEAQIRDQVGFTARDQKTLLLNLKAARETVYLRNPFGDVWLIGLEDLVISRVAGVGTREFCIVTLPYQELSGG